MDSLDNKSFTPIYIHPEEEPNILDLNNNFNNINKDLINLDNIMIETATKYKSLLENAKLKLQEINNQLNAEKERQEDINMLCNMYSNFCKVINLDNTSFTGSLSFTDGLLSAAITEKNLIDYSINNISGNGLAGNSYVYQSDAFLKNTIDTSNESNINDSNIATYYEYQRLTCDNNKNLPLAFNKDNIEAECTLTISSDNYINNILLYSERNDLILKAVYTSDDGNNYVLDKEYNLLINSLYESYNNQSYVYNSGLILIDNKKYVKLVLKSNGYSNDDLAYISTTQENNSTIRIINKVPTAKRHVIKLNDLSVYQNKYNSGSIISNELLSEPIKYISLYCNEYINPNYNIEDYIKYYLYINGNQYEVIPINSQRNGTKIIRLTTSTYVADNTEYINESIKSAYLKIVINSSDDISPFISNIKILIGDEDD